MFQGVYEGKQTSDSGLPNVAEGSQCGCVIFACQLLTEIKTEDREEV